MHLLLLSSNKKGTANEDRSDHRLLVRLWPGDRHAQGWNVIATMRNPRPELLPTSPRMSVIQLDVTDPVSISAALDAAGPFDVLLNNAGIGFLGALEATPMAKTRDVFETNTFGMIAMTQAVVSRFREQKNGTIINVTSSVTLTAMPLVSVYTASKMAIEGFTASLQHELRALGIRAKLLEPGYGPSTRFAENGRFNLQEVIPKPYMAFAQPILEGFGSPAKVTAPTDVAEVVWQAAKDERDRLRYAAGPDAVALARAA
jgi:NAD(P)-dependent dehydrogenase (short-subunit alcohol dehydrogenase family)